MIKYVISKLSHTLYCDSVIVHIIKGRLVILTTGAFVDVIKEIIDEYNRLFNDQFSIVEFYSADFDDSLDIIQKIIEKGKKFKKIDILIANIGTGKSKPGLEADQSEWERIIKLNLMGSINIIKEIRK